MLKKIKERFLTHFNKTLGKAQQYIGFTLAEVLIVLGIIGIICEMTIPTLMNNVQDMQFKTAMKKQYSVFNQVIKLITLDNGGSFASALTSMTSTDGNANDSKLWRDLFATKIKIIKTCDPGIGSSLAYGGCFGSSYKYFTNDYNPMTYNAYIDKTIRYAGVTADGAAYGIWQYVLGNTCQNSGTGVTNTCGELNIDVNGAQNPNKFGKDMFTFIISSNGLYPNTQYGDDCGGGDDRGFGTYCSYKVLMGINY